MGEVRRKPRKARNVYKRVDDMNFEIILALISQWILKSPLFLDFCAKISKKVYQRYYYC